MAVADKLKNAILRELNVQGAFREHLNHEKLLDEIPSKWVQHGDVILFPIEAFHSWGVWSCYPRVFEIISSILKAKTLVRRTGAILNDGYRTPQVQVLHGTDTWAVKKENGIIFTWDVSRVMFSKGNVTEKQRIAGFNCEGQTIVDLYAGIGYFVLPFLIHAKAAKVYAFEWNPQAAYALKKSLELNKVADKCVIMEVDNLRSMSLVKNVADHVNLGMIPSSESTWHCGCGILRRDVGGILHIHANVDMEPTLNSMVVYGDKKNQVPLAWLNWSASCVDTLNLFFQELYPDETWNSAVIGMFKVKSYAPRVDHVVFDVECRPSKRSSSKVTTDNSDE